MYISISSSVETEMGARPAGWTMEEYLKYKEASENDQWGRTMRELFDGSLLRMWDFNYDPKIQKDKRREEREIKREIRKAIRLLNKCLNTLDNQKTCHITED